MKILIWGAGNYCGYVINGINNNVEILAIIDSNPAKKGNKWENLIPIIAPEDVKNFIFDRIVVSVVEFASIQKQCEKMRIPKEKLLFYWEDVSGGEALNNRAERLLGEKKRADIYRARLDSAPFEWGLRYVPTILSARLCLNEIINNGYSLCRFGDGEFNIMLNAGNPWFQEKDSRLKEQLLRVLTNENSKVLIGVAQNFNNFDVYTEDAADDIRLFMEGSMRDGIIKLLDKNRMYYDAYVTRPYIIYRNKSNGKEIFKLFKKIWKDKDLLIVEGRYVRFGVGNDLLSGAKRVKRILCPQTNAWSKYDSIFEKIMKYITKESIVCISLGPTATVLAYDLTLQGVQAIDIGQLDNEYEWFLKKTDKRIVINGKMVAEIPGHPLPSDITSDEYENQIIDEII